MPGRAGRVEECNQPRADFAPAASRLDDAAARLGYLPIAVRVLYDRREFPREGVGRRFAHERGAVFVEKQADIADVGAQHEQSLAREFDDFRGKCCRREFGTR